jgi:hypothetical protein
MSDSIELLACDPKFPTVPRVPRPSHKAALEDFNPEWEDIRLGPLGAAAHVPKISFVISSVTPDLEHLSQHK